MLETQPGLGGPLLVLLELGSGLFQGSLGFGFAGHDGLDHFDHDVLQTDIVGEQRLGTTELDAVQERLPIGLLGNEIGRVGLERTQRGQALGHFGIPLTLTVGEELGEADGLVLNAGALEDGERIGDQQRAGTLGIRAERERGVSSSLIMCFLRLPDAHAAFDT